jgi:large subunit ribosomal protein L19
MRKAEKQFIQDNRPAFKPGDTVSVSLKVREAGKERIQTFQGIVVQKRGAGLGKTFSVRKSSGGVYVERIFPLNSPLVSEIKVVRKGRVRRAKLFYLRRRTGKATRVKEAA